MLLASIPSPSVGVWQLGPLPIRAYAIAILCGIALAWWIMDRRYRAKGGPSEPTLDIAAWAVVFGIIGGRLYHVITDHQLYFGEGKEPIRALYVWEGGLGIWGAIALGAVGVFIAARRIGLRVAPIADSLAPGLLVAQAVGRLGNYFNQELFGAPTTLPWGLEIDDAHLPVGYASGTLFHPTFLYEMLWCLAGAGLLVVLERRLTLAGGQVFALYIVVYTAGRFWIEGLRIDSAHHVLGLRLNQWTAIIVFLGGIVLFEVLRRRMRAVPSANDIWLNDEARDRYLRRSGVDRSDAGDSACPGNETEKDDVVHASSEAGPTEPEAKLV
ncbi:prolipoprotein diacylglyceryl transferase [Arcanobacterium haemolyticum]|nr:prolipoprotein diacylglyceryl transferase [Arcanobacterium haemolyticum]